MRGFVERDIERLSKLWKGQMVFTEKDDRITTMTMKRSYSISDGEKEMLINKVLTSKHGYVSIEGEGNYVTVSATVKPSPESIHTFCSFAKQLDEG